MADLKAIHDAMSQERVIEIGGRMMRVFGSYPDPPYTLAPYLTPEQIVAMPPPPWEYHLTAWELQERFSDDVQFEIELHKATDPVVKIFFRKIGDAMDSNGYLDINDPSFEKGLAYLENKKRSDGTTPLLTDQDVVNLKLPKPEWDEAMQVK